MSKSEKVFNWLLIGIFAILFVCIKQVAADPANSFGEAQFYNPVHIPRNGIVDRFLLDPGMNGDLQSGDGSMETWAGTVGGCTVCPANYFCNCLLGGDIAQETTKIYDFDSSAKISATGALNSLLSYRYTLEANKAYQMDFCYVGEDGTEDVAWGVSNEAFSDSYNFATDTFTGAPTFGSALNIGTDWACRSAYVLTGAAGKTNYFFVVGMASADGSFIYVDEYRVRELHTVGVVGERGNLLSVPVTADPLFGSSPLLQHKPGSGQVTERGMKLDGVDDYVFCLDADCEMDPVLWDSGGSFSIGCRAMPDTVAAGLGVIISKYGGGGNRSWLFERNANTVRFVLSDDGTNATTIGTAGVLGADRLHNMTVRYNYDGVTLNADAWVNVDETVVVSSNVMRGPPLDSTRSFQIGSFNLGASFWTGQVGECTIWESDIGAVAANKYRNPYFPGTNHGDGFYVESCDQAASHATCTLDSCRDGTPAACQAEGTGVMAVFGQREEVCADNSGETLTGDDSDPDFTHWVETEVAGDGSANITAYRADVHHGQVSFRLTTTGTTSQADIASTCIPVSPATEYYIYAKTKKLSGTARFWPILIEYSDGACTNSILSNTLYDGDIAEGGWGNALDTSVTTNGSTNSVLLDLLSYQSASDFLVDEISVKAASYHTPWVHNVGAGSTTYNARDYRLHNPLSDRSDVLREDMYADGWCLGIWVDSDWDGDDGVAHFFVRVPGTAGNNNRWQISKTASDRLYFDFYDGAGAIRNIYLAATNVNFTSGSEKYIEVCTDNSTLIKAHHYNVSNSTWYDWTVASGVFGAQTSQSDELHLGHSAATSFCDCYMPRINISSYSEIWPNEGFNSGRAPVNGRAY